MTQVTQTLKLEDTPKINSRFFDEGKILYAHSCHGWEICPRHTMYHGWEMSAD